MTIKNNWFVDPFWSVCFVVFCGCGGVSTHVTTVQNDEATRVWWVFDNDTIVLCESDPSFTALRNGRVCRLVMRPQP